MTWYLSCGNGWIAAECSTGGSYARQVTPGWWTVGQHQCLGVPGILEYMIEGYHGLINQISYMLITLQHRGVSCACRVMMMMV
jgi:hypothetical protein